MNAPKYQDLKVIDIAPTPDNPRRIDRKSAKFLELLDSVKAGGVKIPIVVRPAPDEAGKYDMRAGARRLAASITAGRETIPALVYKDMTDEEAFDMTFIENFSREDLTPLEEGEAVATLLVRYHNDRAAVAGKLGRSERWVRLRERVHNNLADVWKKKAAEADSALTISHLDMIARLEADDQAALFATLYEWEDEVVTVELIRRETEQLMKGLEKAGWKLDEEMEDEEGKLGACLSCPRRTGAEPLLWDDLDGKKKAGDRCLNQACFARKRMIALKKQAEQLAKTHPNLVIMRNYDCDYDIPEKVAKVFPTIITPDNYQTVKAKDKGALPCLMISGHATGKLQWMQPRRGASGRIKVAGPKPMETKRAGLESKRWGRVIKDFQEWLESEASPVETIASPDKVFGLLVMTQWLGVGYGGDRSMRSADVQAKLGILGKPKEQSLAHEVAAVWNLVKGELSGRIRYTGPVTQMSKAHIDEVKHAAECVNYPIATAYKKAVEAVPEPKSWAKERTAAAAKKKVTKPAKEKAVRTCRKCGCTGDNPCISATGEACHWTEADLCSLCAPKAGKKAAETVSPGQRHGRTV